MATNNANRRDADVWSMADLATPMALRVMATLRIADLITNGQESAFQLADATQVDIHALDQVLRHLVSVDLLSRDEAGRYALTARGESLRDDHPSGMRGLLDIESAIGRADLSFAQLLHSVRTGSAAFPLQFGMDFWDDLASDAARRGSYDRQMGSDVVAWAPSILAAYDWGSLGQVIDVGGGNGTLLAALLRAHPTLKGRVLDQPGAVEAAAETLAKAGLTERCDVVAGSFFDPLPAGADGYVLCAILHDWNDTAAVAILRRCADAVGATGRVFVIEKTGNDGQSPRTEMDLRMLVYFGGRERGVNELVSLAGGAGLGHVEVHHNADLSILELRRA